MKKDRTGAECDIQGGEDNAIDRQVGKPEENDQHDLV